MEAPFRFIIIDDDSINNTLCSVIIRRITDKAEIRTFNFPEKGFDYLTKELTDSETPTVLFLDINMPGWTGWVFLENFEMLDSAVKQHVKIYMLSSSVDPQDKERALTSKNVVDFIVKPLTKDKVISILSKYLLA